MRMKTNRKIDFYSGPRYLCSTMQSKTLDEALEKFMKAKSYQGIKPDGRIGICTWEDTEDNRMVLEARWSKE
jgi:hypothetical protein